MLLLRLCLGLLFVSLSFGCTTELEAVDSLSGMQYTGLLSKSDGQSTFHARAISGDEVSGTANFADLKGSAVLSSKRTVSFIITGSFDQGQGANSDGTFWICWGSPWYRKGWRTVVPLGPVSHSVSKGGGVQANDPEIQRLQKDWYFYTAAPRSRSEAAFRVWSGQSGKQSVLVVKAGERTPELAVFRVFQLCETQEMQLRAAMAQEGYSQGVIDGFIADEKAKVADVIRRDLLPTGGH